MWLPWSPSLKSTFDAVTRNLLLLPNLRLCPSSRPGCSTAKNRQELPQGFAQALGLSKEKDSIRHNLGPLLEMAVLRTLRPKPNLQASCWASAQPGCQPVQTCLPSPQISPKNAATEPHPLGHNLPRILHYTFQSHAQLPADKPHPPGRKVIICRPGTISIQN